MKLSPKLAQSIVREMMSQLTYNINMMDENGYIIASGDPSRVNTLHIGALNAIKQKKTLTMSDSHGENGQPGVNMPVLFENKIIGVIGITGDPKKVLQFASILKTTTELLISQENTNIQENQSEKKLDRFLYQWAQVTDDISQHTELMLNARELNIDVLKDYIAIALQGTFTSPIPIDIDDHIISISDTLTIVITYRKTTISRISTFAKRKGLKIGISLSNSIISKSIDQALKTLKIAKILKEEKYQYFEQIEFIYSLLSNNLSTETLVNSFKILDETENGHELVRTLLSFIENNQNINQTADALHVHRNTLNYRLKKIHDDLHLDPHKLIDLFQLYVGYLYYSQDQSDFKA
ncbi:CdaR family transcriptional regulator [Lentilactobacillus hilgardii]|uniref:CdaR family transcriptional regulator n=1 Tax=Lentilactobacillus hilgardii TaxID=1588 RepID=UPI0039EABB25